MKYVVEVQGRRMTVDYDGSHVEVDGKRVEASIVNVHGTPVRLLRVGNAVHRIVARRNGERGRYVVDVEGERLDVLALDERTYSIRELTAAQAGPSGPAPLLAPMPGLVVRVTATVGERVVAGQGLVVIEAMKMENELRASAAGLVTAVRAVPGTAVEKGALLVELGPIDTGSLAE